MICVAIFKHFYIANVAMTFVVAVAVIAAVRQSANAKIKTSPVSLAKIKTNRNKNIFPWFVHRFREATKSNIEI